MIRFEITDFQELRRTLGEPHLVEKAMRWALDKATQKARTRISVETRKRYNVKAGDISKHVQLRRLTDGRVLIYTGQMIGLDHFDAKYKKLRASKGKRGSAKRQRVPVTVLVRKDKGRKVVKSGFIGTARTSAAQLLFVRVPGTRMPSKPGKEQLRRLYGPSIAHMVSNEFVANQVTAQATIDLADEFDRTLTLLMEQAHK